MKREIVFRGLRTDNNEWVYGSLWNHSHRGNHSIMIGSGTTSSSCNGFEVIPETVGQFTGLKDRNGKEVYEGDLISDGEKEPMILPVIYSDEYAMFCVDISYNKDGGSIEEILSCYEDGFTVVGNIHESHELLNN